VNTTVTTIVWAAPVSAVLVSALIWLLRSWILKRLTSSIQHEYDKDLAEHKAKLKAQSDADLVVHKSALKAQTDAELEVHKANAQRLVHIDQSHFDLELASYQKLWTAISAAVDLTAQTANLYSFNELPEGAGEKRKTAVTADEAFFVAIKTTQKLRPFIPLEIHDQAATLAAHCKAEIDTFFHALTLEKRNDRSYNQEEMGKAAKLAEGRLMEQWNSLADAIQRRLQSIPGEQVQTRVTAVVSSDASGEA
jgi:hypothetical protein